MPRITIERMSHDDVPAVMAVDRLCFPTPWSENAYRSEMGNVSAHYLVARLRGHWSGGGSGGAGRLVGFAGAWDLVLSPFQARLAAALGEAPQRAARRLRRHLYRHPG